MSDEKDVREARKEAEQPILEIAGNSDACATFMLRGQDHTLGNAVRYMLAKRPGVEFAGYSIPHPSEDLLNIRVQTMPGGESAAEAFRGSLRDLTAIAAIISSKFAEAANKMEE